MARLRDLVNEAAEDDLIAQQLTIVVACRDETEYKAWLSGWKQAPYGPMFKTAFLSDKLKLDKLSVRTARRMYIGAYEHNVRRLEPAFNALPLFTERDLGETAKRGPTFRHKKLVHRVMVYSLTGLDVHASCGSKLACHAVEFGNEPVTCIECMG
jgi:hypothetical protein